MRKIFYESKIAKALLWSGYSTITIGCFILTKLSREQMGSRVVTHEFIHVEQWKELTELWLIVAGIFCLLGASLWWMVAAPFAFYILYVLEWLYRTAASVFKRRTLRNAAYLGYRAISFEREARVNEVDTDYPKYRCLFSWIAYI